MKSMTMHNALDPTDNSDRLYITRKEGGRGFASIKTFKNIFFVLAKLNEQNGQNW